MSTASFHHLYALQLNHSFYRHDQTKTTPLVVVMLAFHRCNREPSCVHAIVIDHVIGLDPQKLVALMIAQLRKCGLVPPEPLLAATAALSSIIGICHSDRTFTTVDFKSPVRGNKWSVSPVSLYPTTLCGPVIRIPYWAIHSHGLVLWVGYPFVFHVRVYPNWSLIHQKSEQKKTEEEEDEYRIHCTQNNLLSLKNSQLSWVYDIQTYHSPNIQHNIHILQVWTAMDALRQWIISHTPPYSLSYIVQKLICSIALRN